MTIPTMQNLNHPARAVTAPGLTGWLDPAAIGLFEREVAMLNQQDRRRLAAIERQMLIDDPAFARRLARGSVVPRSTWRRAAFAIIGILCGLATCVGLLSSSGMLTAS